jgi:16S rRNA (guanine527-N7)-methyltransferase
MSTETSAISSSIATGLSALAADGRLNCAVDVNHHQLTTALSTYIAELTKWNKAYNLTAIRDSQAMVTLHLLDSLAASPWLYGKNILDVGTGAGLPGIPLALVQPDVKFTLLDTNGKKVRFVKHVAGVLELENVLPVQARIEEYAPALLFDSIISRAFSSLADFIAGSAHALAPDGRLLAMKGKLPNDELAELPEGWCVSRVEELHVPRLEAERHLLVLERQTKAG